MVVDLGEDATLNEVVAYPLTRGRIGELTELGTRLDARIALDDEARRRQEIDAVDPDPVVGLTTDEQRLIEVGEEGVLAMVCDSTNVFVPGTSGSEGDVRVNLEALVAKCERRVVVACFASNVARLETIARVGEATGRSVALVGRSLWRIYEAAKENGFLTDIPPFITEKDVGYMPPDRVLMICTGSQGEPRAALPRIAGGEHRDVALETGDTVIFSSRVIPGNEMAIGRLHNRLMSKGIEVITASDAAIHVSGHPARDELIQMYNWIRPQIAVPVHGEARHMIAHAKLARDCQVPQPIVTQNGSMVRLAPGRAEIIDEFSKRKGHAVLVAQLQAGGVGVNLQAASAVVLMEPQWKPSTENQAIARSHRMGQTRRVHVHRLLAADTVDERMSEMLAGKLAVFQKYARPSHLKDASPQATEASFGTMVMEVERARLGLG